MSQHILQRVTICDDKHENYDKTPPYSKREEKDD